MRCAAALSPARPIGPALALVLVAAVALAAAPSGKVARIGYLTLGALDSAEQQAVLGAWREGLSERGYVEGQNLQVEYRAAGGQIERLPGLAAELARLNVDVIVAPTTPTARAAQRATATIPIVSFAMGDPVGDKLVASLARPGGNVTGLTFLGPELIPKRLELLKETLPRIARVAALWHPGAFGERTSRDMLDETEAAAQARGVRVQRVEVRTANELEGAFAAMRKERADAVLVFPSPMLFNQRRRVAALTAEHRLPAMFVAREFVELGGLFSYGASLADLTRRGAIYVDRILKGARPADLPVEQPTRFELVINMTTARSLGVTIPRSLLVRADQLIE